MPSRTRQLAIELFNGIVAGELSLNMVTALIDGWLNEFVEAAIEHRINISVADTPAAEPPVQSVSEPERKPRKARKAKTLPGDDDHARVDFETGRITHKRKRRGHIWVRAKKNADGVVIRKGYWVSKRKLGWAKGKKLPNKTAEALGRQKYHGMSKQDYDMLHYYRGKFKKLGWTFTGTSLAEARLFNESMTGRLTQKLTPELRAKREKSRLAFYKKRAEKNGWPIPQTLEEGVKQNYKSSVYGPGVQPPPADETTPPNDDKKTATEATAPLKTAAVRVYQPHVRKAGKTYRKMRKKAAQQRAVKPE